MDFSGYFYNDRGQPLNLVKVEAFNPATGASIAVVYTNTSGYWVFTGLTVVPKIQIYFPFNYVVVQDARQEQLRSQRAQADGYPSLDSAGKVPIAQLPTAAPTASIDIGDAAAEGTAPSVPRADHQHSFPAPSVAPTKVSTAPDTGTSTTPARNDHVHDMGIITALGDILYQDIGTADRLPGNTTTTRKFLRQVGTGALSAAPVWDTLADGDIPATIARDAEVTTAVNNHAAAADPHTGYRLESADHSHQSTGLQAGQLDHGLALTGLTDDDHTQYLKEEASGGLASEVPDHTHSGAAEAGGPLLAANTHASPAEDTHHAKNHGAAEHTDRTRSIWLPPRVFGATQGTPALVAYGVTAADSAEAWAFDAAADESIGTAFELPSDWVPGTNVVFEFRWAADTATSGAVLWYLTLTSIADGDSIDETYSYNPSATGTASATARARVTTLISSVPAANFAAGSTVRIRVARLGSFAADTMTGDALLLGVLVSYTADM